MTKQTKTQEKACEKCKGELEYKFSLNDGSGDYNDWATKIYQCSKCKNVESK